MASRKNRLDHDATRFNPAVPAKSILLRLKQGANARLKRWRIHDATRQHAS
jgi:hypothetical protein